MEGRNIFYIVFNNPILIGYVEAFLSAPGIFPFETKHKGLILSEDLKALEGFEPFVNIIGVGTKDYVTMNNPNFYHKV